MPCHAMPFPPPTNRGASISLSFPLRDENNRRGKKPEGCRMLLCPLTCFSWLVSSLANTLMRSSESLQTETIRKQDTKPSRPMGGGGRHSSFYRSKTYKRCGRREQPDRRWCSIRIFKATDTGWGCATNILCHSMPCHAIHLSPRPASVPSHHHHAGQEGMRRTQVSHQCL